MRSPSMKTSTDSIPRSLTAQPETSPMPERVESWTGSSMLKVISANAGEALAQSSRKAGKNLDLIIFHPP